MYQLEGFLRKKTHFGSFFIDSDIPNIEAALTLSEFYMKILKISVYIMSYESEFRVRWPARFEGVRF